MTSQIVSSSFNVQLHSDASGLSLKKKRKNSISFIHLSKFASKGLFFQTSIPQNCVVIIFPHLSSANSENILSCYIVICNSGEIFLVLFQKTGVGESTKVGQIQANIVWADFVIDQLCILESCGKLHVGRIHCESNSETEGQIKWKSISLPLIPVSCISMDNILVLTNGLSSFIYEIGDWKLDIHSDILKLPYCGVIGLEKTSNQVVLTTCDGRQYVKSFASLKEFSKNSTKDLKSDSLFIKDISLSSVMKSIKRYSDYTRKGRSKLDNINLYLEQIFFAQSFLSELPESPFTVQLSVSCMEEEEIFILAIKLKQIMLRNKLQGPWWQLNIKLKGCDNISCLYSDLIDINTDVSHFIKFKIPFTFVENFISNLNQEVNIEFDLSFSHFSTMKPLCTFSIHKEPLDVLCFLSSVSSRSLPSRMNPSFEIKVHRLFESFHDKREEKEKNISSHQNVIVLLRQKLQPVLEPLFPEIVAGNKSSLSCTKWLRHDMVKLTCDKKDINQYEVSIEGISYLITAIKFALEKRAFKYLISDDNRNSSLVKLQPDYYKKILITKAILDLETSTECPSDIALQRIWDSLNNLIASIFL